MSPLDHSPRQPRGRSRGSVGAPARGRVAALSGLLVLLVAAWIWRLSRGSAHDVAEESPPSSPAAASTRAEPQVRVPPAPARAPSSPPRVVVSRPRPLPPAPIAPSLSSPPLRAAVESAPGVSPVDVSDTAIATFGPETIAMLNGHKYWSVEQGAFVDRLYDVWLDKKSRGDDVEDIRQQIAWALQGTFMESY